MDMSLYKYYKKSVLPKFKIIFCFLMTFYIYSIYFRKVWNRHKSYNGWEDHESVFRYRKTFQQKNWSVKYR